MESNSGNTSDSSNETAKSRYMKTEKYKQAKQRYYETKGRETSKAYYEKNKEKIIERSMERYRRLKAHEEPKI